MVIVAISGCVHGEIDLLYKTLAEHEQYKGVKADILLCTGDFQAIRDNRDLNSLSCPPKYRKLGDFQGYYTGQKKAPILTIIIGGNHESVLYMNEAIHGGWIAPNMYYMGRSGVIQCGSLRIAGLSGIYKAPLFNSPIPEFPRSEKDFKTIYHIREIDVRPLFQISPPDIMMTHDWPQGIYNFGNTEELLKKKPFLREEIANNTLGNPITRQLFERIAP